MGLTCLSRTLTVADYAELVDELRLVASYQANFGEQHPQRRWEYALALQAITRWRASGRPFHAGAIYDIDVTGTPFHHILSEWTGQEVTLLAPVAPGDALGRFCVGGTPLADVVTCLGVIEHVLDEERFLFHLSCLLAPGGLLVLTMDYWNQCGPDTATNHELRARIYCPKTYAQLRLKVQALGLSPFGGVDPTWHGVQVHDYSYASLVLEKRR